MCNHYANNPEQMAKLQNWREYIGWSIDTIPDNVAVDVWPKRRGLVARDVDGQTRVDAMTWGVPLVVPGKRPGIKITKHVTNVRNLSSPFWRSMLASSSQRCLVPFTGFAEPKAGAGREEWWFTLKERPVGAFAGIWRATDAGDVFAFLTCEPNPMVEAVHPKAMPVILHEEDYGRWPAGDDAEQLAQPYPSQLMGMA